MGRFRLIPVKPDLKKLKKLERDITAAIDVGLEEEAKVLEKELRKPTRTWSQGSKPSFRTKRIKRRFFRSIAVRTTSTPYVFLAVGTSVRYATMRSGYRRKTRPGSLDAYPGGGGVAFISRRNPRPGIRARDWHKIVAQQRTKPFAKQVQRKIRIAVLKYRLRRAFRLI